MSAGGEWNTMIDPRRRTIRPAAQTLVASSDDTTALVLRLAASAVTFAVAVFLTLVR